MNENSGFLIYEVNLCLQVDLFFYREPEEAKEDQEDDVAVAADYSDYAAAGALGMGDQWSAQLTEAQWDGETAQLPIAGAPVAAGVTGWSGADGKNLGIRLFIFVCVFFFLYVDFL